MRILRFDHKLPRVRGMLADPVKMKKPVYIEDPHEVFAEVKRIVLLLYPDFDFRPLQKVFRDILRLFAGEYPGYRQCNTRYHDLNHTTDCLLVMIRLIHGAFVSGVAFSKKDLHLGLISALMHDTGYIQTIEDSTGTGGKYTLTHIQRSIDFMQTYFRERGCPPEDFPPCRDFLHCTGLDVKIHEIDFQSREHEILGKILGTADLIGQMSDKHYLEKLPFLYREFKEGGVPGFSDELDLFQKTPYFWDVVKKRFTSDLGQVDAYLRLHFRECWGIDQDLYHLAIDRNIESLLLIMANRGVRYQVYRDREEICWA
jgi:hypothetical protein